MPYKDIQKENAPEIVWRPLNTGEITNPISEIQNSMKLADLKMPIQNVKTSKNGTVSIKWSTKTMQTFSNKPWNKN